MKLFNVFVLSTLLGTACKHIPSKQDVGSSMNQPRSSNLKEVDGYDTLLAVDVNDVTYRGNTADSFIHFPFPVSLYKDSLEKRYGVALSDSSSNEKDANGLPVRASLLRYRNSYLQVTYSSQDSQPYLCAARISDPAFIMSLGIKVGMSRDAFNIAIPRAKPLKRKNIVITDENFVTVRFYFENSILKDVFLSSHTPC
jgi:hypothetical protein